MDFEIILLNPASKKIFDIDYAIADGKKLTEHLAFSNEEGWVRMFKDVIENGAPLNYEYFSPHLKKWLFLVAVKLGDGIAVTISDISQRKNALKELMETEKLAVTGRIARSIAHEVRNPLTNVNLSLEQLKDDLQEPSASTVTYLDIIRRNSERINQLITEMLNSSKPTHIELDKHDINKLLDETLKLAADRIHLKKIRVEKNYDEHMPDVMLDAEKIKIAFLNLIINGLEVLEEEKGILTINTLMKNNLCTIEIEDNGYGISEENLNNVFEPFFSKKASGMGLGLTATRNIILAHAGTIEVESILNKGTKFVISLKIIS